MILVGGIPSEQPLALAIEAAERAGVPVVALNQREIREWDVDVVLCDGHVEGTLTGPGGVWSLDAFAGVYLRFVEPASLPDLRCDGDDGPDAELLGRAQALHDIVVDWTEIAPVRVANRLSASSSNLSKPYQMQLIEDCGFAVPPTLVTNDPGELRRFAREHGRVVYKSVSSVRSIVTELVPARARQIGRIRNLPTQFQALVEGTDVRVHVVGTEVFATEVRTEAVDYRYAGRDGHDVEMEAYELPELIRARCVDLGEALALPFCGVDLRRTPGGEWVCFEVNPSPAYSYYEGHSGQAISDALVRYLSGAQEGT